MTDETEHAASAWDGLTDQDVVEVTLTDGAILSGSLMRVAGMTFLTYHKPGALLGSSHGPIDPDGVERVRLVKAWSAIKAERFAALRGEPFAGPAPRLALDYEYRLERLARAIATEADAARADQLRRQFDDTADEIALSQPKRAWMRAAGRWALKSNAPPTMEDLWFAEVASPSLMTRPRPQDFDPDPAVRRRRFPLPDQVLRDPASVPNRLKALRAAGLKARPALTPAERFRTLNRTFLALAAATLATLYWAKIGGPAWPFLLCAAVCVIAYVASELARRKAEHPRRSAQTEAVAR